MRKILVSITTTRGSDCKAKIKEAKELGLTEAALFPTCLEKEDRELMYKLAKEAGIKSAPFVHIRSDMSLEELSFLKNTFGTKVFNLHTNAEYEHIYDYPEELRKIIFIENVYQPIDEEEIKKFAGMCLDVTHLHNDKSVDQAKFEHNISLLNKYPIGCNHISAFPNIKRYDDMGYMHHDSHRLKDLSDLDYIREYPDNYFSQYIALELENSLKEQLRAREYIAKIKNL